MSVELGEKQLQVFKYLAFNPDKSISEIQKALGDKHSNLISKPVYSLKDSGFLIESSIYEKKGNIISRYELNEGGVIYALFTFTPEERGVIIKNYGDKYPDYKYHYRVFLDLDEVLGPKYQILREGILKRVGKTLFSFSKTGYHGDEAIALLQRLWEIEFKRLNITKKEDKELKKRAKLYPMIYNKSKINKGIRKLNSRARVIL